MLKIRKRAKNAKERSAKGGSAPKRLKGILSAVKKMIQDKPLKSDSATKLWNTFRRLHSGINQAILMKGFIVYYDSENDNLIQVSSTGKVGRIGERTFKDYVREAKVTLK